MKTVLLDRLSLDLGDLDLSRLEALASELTLWDRSAPDDVAPRVAHAECVIVNKVVLDRTLIESCPALKLICVVATGTNNIDLEAAAARGVTVVNCRGYGTDSLAQHVFALVLALSRSLFAYDRAVRNGDWQRTDQFCLLDYPIREFGDLTLGIVGAGELGGRVAQLGELLGMTVWRAERPGASELRPGRRAFDEVVTGCDVLTLHCPLTAETRGLIGRAELQRMKSTALLINTARGGVVDEAALADALREGQIAAAGVDVLSREPPNDGNPLLAADIPNLIVTPHCAWGSHTARQRVVDQTVENITAWQAGNPVRVVAGPASSGTVNRP